ncbi:MAG: hypothetical protein HYY78_19875 [Betaproteobacteria bacterium]|nr:hypothetical protein [Betaproteobacteria bacterium]
MKIDRVEIFGVAVPLIGEYKNAYLSKTVQKSAVVRITADGGVSGLGNIDPTPGYSKEQTADHLEVLRSKLAPLLVGMDATNVHAVLAKIEPAVKGFLDSKATIEMACVDLAARIAGMPVHAYLGGAVKERLLFNAWIGILPPDEAAKETLGWKKKGFRSAKIKVGGNTMAEIMLAATSSNVIDGLECVGPLKTADDIVTRKLDLSSGSLPLPGGPGLGVTLDDAKLAKYRLEVKAAA